MRLGKMTKKQVLKPSCNSDKSIAICEFVNVQFPICGIDVSVYNNLVCKRNLVFERHASQETSVFSTF